MQPFRTHTGTIAPLSRPDIDTDQIIPKQFLKRLGRTGFADALFFDWRAARDGGADAAFVLNDSRYAGASILLTGANFGCGSSREHAVWALWDYGFRVVLAPSFADIFAGNAVANGLLAATLDQATHDALVQLGDSASDAQVTVDLERQRITAAGMEWTFGIDPRARTRLLEGLDDIALILRHEDAIRAYETAHRR